MVEFLTAIYLTYMFIALYFLFLFILTFVGNRHEMFDFPELEKKPSLSVLVPAYNEEESIEDTVKSILNSDYSNILEVIVINDGSKDRTKEIGEMLEKRYFKVRLLDKENSGKADSLNQALKIAKGELVAVVDSDSFPSKDAFSKMVGFLEEPKVAAVTTRILVRNPTTFIQKLQSIEYKVIAFTRKMLGFLDAIYVTPGPLAIYNKRILMDVGSFDTKNITEDIEVTWRLAFEGYRVRFSFLPAVTTVAPHTFKRWFKQRIRWNVGGFQTMWKYKKYFFRKGMLGFFILPFFSISLLLGIVGLSIFIYRLSKRFLLNYLATKYSLITGSAIVNLQEINLNPSILHFFGIILFLAGLLFILFALYFVNERVRGRESLITILFYSVVYMTLYPVILITSSYKYLRGTYSW